MTGNKAKSSLNKNRPFLLYFFQGKQRDTKTPKKESQKMLSIEKESLMEKALLIREEFFKIIEKMEGKFLNKMMALV